jgi:hypothetical protein
VYFGNENSKTVFSTNYNTSAHRRCVSNHITRYTSFTPEREAAAAAAATDFLQFFISFCTLNFRALVAQNYIAAFLCTY